MLFLFITTRIGTGPDGVGQIHEGVIRHRGGIQRRGRMAEQIRVKVYRPVLKEIGRSQPCHIRS